MLLRNHAPQRTAYELSAFITVEKVTSFFKQYYILYSPERLSRQMSKKGKKGKGLATKKPEIKKLPQKMWPLKSSQRWPLKKELYFLCGFPRGGGKRNSWMQNGFANQ